MPRPTAAVGTATVAALLATGVTTAPAQAAPGADEIQAVQVGHDEPS
ncbi:hypothetical protein I5Q34_05800 [Streptomyces sp. AV19]|nr:hypothetical protein [Streptomyces sp. AV19]MBH1933815.1 hypothetical protein [Streptomyces sp. AV19]MDG4535680.1 hypothetical protein [Streptomyces sp. AV19]